MDRIENAVTDILQHIGEDINREGLKNTPSRVRKSFEFLCSGYKLDPKDIINSALFDTDNSQMVMVRDIEFYSTCEHHLLPFFGKAYVAYVPDKKVVGLSKIPRIVDIFAKRLQLQENMTTQISQAIFKYVKPKGVAVMLQARHMCMESRGVQKVCSTTTSFSYDGVFKEDKVLQNQFLNMVKPSYKE